MAGKAVGHAIHREVCYDQNRWQQLNSLRSKATRLMEILERVNLVATTHGSIARGDVTEESDIDIFIPNPFSSFKIEVTLQRAHIQIGRRLIVQATPFYAVKGYVEVGEKQTVSFPLVKMRQVERGFYRFGGEITLAELKEDRRVVGVNKRLVLVEPTDKGHFASSIVGREEETAKLLGVPAETVFDRVHALQRREAIGRTGVFVERMLLPDQTFEMALKKLAETKPEVRRRLKTRKR